MSGFFVSEDLDLVSARVVWIVRFLGICANSCKLGVGLLLRNFIDWLIDLSMLPWMSLHWQCEDERL